MNRQTAAAANAAAGGGSKRKATDSILAEKDFIASALKWTTGALKHDPSLKNAVLYRPAGKNVKSHVWKYGGVLYDDDCEWKWVCIVCGSRMAFYFTATTSNYATHLLKCKCSLRTHSCPPMINSVLCWRCGMQRIKSVGRP